MNTQTLKIRLLVPDNEFLNNFNFLLQAGFKIEAEVDCSVFEFLNRQCTLPEDYIQKRISTIFLNGNPVDDIKTALIEEDSVLSLSGAMPGLVGAVMRTGGFYASFRNSITYKKSGNTSNKGRGQFKLKLFNILMKEIGPLFLKEGIFLLSSDFINFLNIQKPDFFKNCRQVTVNEKPVNSDFFENRVFLEKHDNIFLRIEVSG